MAEVASNVRVGNVISYRNSRYKVIKRQHVQPGKGGAFYQMELKNIQTGQKLNERFRSEDKLDMVMVENIPCQVLYIEGNTVHFMDQQNFEQFELDKDFIGEGAAFLKDEMLVTVEFADGEPISVDLPTKVQAIITETDPYLKNATVTSSYKKAILDNGIQIKVPPFIEQGQKVNISVSVSDEGGLEFIYDSKAA